MRHQEQDIVVRLFISPPAAGASTRADQHMYINRRPVRGDQISKHLTLLHRQVKSFLDKGTAKSPRSRTANANAFPAYICFVEAPERPHDVTFEPDKSQVEFADWGPLLACVQRAAVKAWHAYVPSVLLQDCAGPELAQAAAVSRDSSLALSGRCADRDQLQPCQIKDAFQLDELSSPQDTALAGLLSRSDSPVYQPDARFGLQREEEEMCEGGPPKLQLGSAYLSAAACEEGDRAHNGPSGNGSDWDAWQGLDTGGLGQASTFQAAFQRVGECQPALQHSQHRPASSSQQERDRPGLVVPTHIDWDRARQQQFKGVQHASSNGPHLGWRKPRGCGLGSSDLVRAPERFHSPARQGARPGLLRDPQITCNSLRSVFGNLEEDLECAVNGAGNGPALMGQGCASQRGEGQGKRQSVFNGSGDEHLREVEEAHPIALQVQFASRPVRLQGEPSRRAVDCASSEGGRLRLSPSSRAALRQSPPDSSITGPRQAYHQIPAPSDGEDDGTSPLPCMRRFSPGGRLDPSSSPSDFVLAPSPAAACVLQNAQSVDTPERLHFAGHIPFATLLDRTPGFNLLAEPESLSPLPCIESASPGSPIPRLEFVSTPDRTFPAPCGSFASPLSSLQLLDTQRSRPAQSCKASTSPFSVSPLQALELVGGVEEDTPRHSRADQGARRQSLSPRVEFVHSPRGRSPGPVVGRASCHYLEESAMPAVAHVAVCSRIRKRASSAPPQARKKVKTAHTNPISSLKCSGRSPSLVPGHPGLDAGAADRAEGQRGRLTVQGVHCDLPRQISRTTGKSLGRSRRDGVASGELRQASLLDMGMRQRKRRQSDCNESLSHQQAKRPQEQV